MGPLNLLMRWSQCACVFDLEQRVNVHALSPIAHSHNLIASKNEWKVSILHRPLLTPVLQPGQKVPRFDCVI